MDPVLDSQGVGFTEPFDGGTNRDSPGSDDQLVVGKKLLVTVGVGDEEFAALDVDATSHRVEAQSHAGRLEVGDGPVRQVAPMGDLPRDVVRDAADGEVGVGVRHDDGHLGVGV